MDNSNDKETVIIEHRGFKGISVSIDDIPSSMHLVADLCGLDVAISLMQKVNGLIIAVPSNGFQKIEKKIILQEYKNDPLNIKKLALQLNLNEQTVRGTVNKYCLKTADGQLSLFQKEDLEKNNVKS